MLENGPRDEAMFAEWEISTIKLEQAISRAQTLRACCADASQCILHIACCTAYHYVYVDNLYL